MAPHTTFDPVPVIASDLGLPEGGVRAVVTMLAGGNTVPFLARYRKEATGGLDEVQIRAIGERHAYLADLERRREAILTSIEGQGKLGGDLAARIRRCRTKAELEDLYLPFKPKRRTRATAARERGLEPLAARILEQPPQGDPRGEAEAFAGEGRGVANVEAALAGARDIVAEAAAEDADVRAIVREALARHGVLRSREARDRGGERSKYEQYYDYREKVRAIPSHRYLAIRRGEREGVLRVGIEVDDGALVSRILDRMGWREGSPFGTLMREAVEDGYRRLLFPSVESSVRVDLKARADESAVEVFANNLRSLLLAPPLGGEPVIGVDPGIRTGCKCAAVDATGKYLDSITIFPARGESDRERAAKDWAAFVGRHRPRAVAVGNGTAGRETEGFLRGVAAAGRRAEPPLVVQVNEAGASVYSASETAREEFPDLDVSIRGGISIARRLQDPLAELVKIDPKSIGVGQYQHDVYEPLLRRKLDEVVESCVNHVGVELNTASAALLARVAGIGPSLAKRIVRHRESTGPFSTREDLLGVSGLGPRAFEQAAGFLRIRGGRHPLDASAVHPERYGLVESIAADLGTSLEDLVGNRDLARRIDPSRYRTEGVGEPTLRDIVAELEKPGRDPRSSFEPPRFRDDVRSLGDLAAGMELEGVVTNVTDFGAFVDVGVHHDGLVHVSELSDGFVRSPHEAVRTGEKIRVRVLEVDVERKRISLSARPAGGGARKGKRRGKPQRGKPHGGKPQRGKPPKAESFEQALKRLQSRFNTRP